MQCWGKMQAMTIMPDWEAQLPAELVEELRALHAGPKRAYHDWRHIEELLALFAEVEPTLHDPRAVLFALLFHDAVYDPHSVDNERSSAELLASLAGDALSAESLERAREMVLATVGHALPGGLSVEEREDLACFLDLDLAILGADPARYAEYEAQIRREYADIPEDTYRPARAAILQRFLRREPIYFTEWGRAKFEAQARANLARSIEQLRGTSARAG